VASCVLSEKTSSPRYSLTVGLPHAKMLSRVDRLVCGCDKTGNAIEPEDEEEEKEDDYEWLKQRGAGQLHDYWPSEARQGISGRVWCNTIRGTVSDGVL
jgi:sarcosine oxidase delta subunit